ncbi:AWS domain [Arabidopsis thaliana x Arabidopsis arenosa]|uniref:AWS domain n=1 Tax=Arabidopsis thaliana x Arabidopsis arenosa TaxID=1240361 RepID=A0A8T2BIJ6_9BRAS|nr:AWS domain [Arabidopsis thaliana x Arabidopsis arenosa]
MADHERDRDLLIPVADSGDRGRNPATSYFLQTLSLFIRGWASKKFMTGWSRDKQRKEALKIRCKLRLHTKYPLTSYSSFLQINQTVKLRFQKFKTRVKDHGIFCFCSLDPGSSTICGSDCNCGILLSSCSSSSKCRSDCTNKPFQQRHIKKMKSYDVKHLQ